MMTCDAFDRADPVLLHEEFADSDDLLFRKVFMKKWRVRSFHEVLATSKTEVLLVPSSIGPFLDYVLSFFLLEALAFPILACDVDLSSWPRHEGLIACHVIKLSILGHYQKMAPHTGEEEESCYSST